MQSDSGDSKAPFSQVSARASALGVITSELMDDNPDMPWVQAFLFTAMSAMDAGWHPTAPEFLAVCSYIESRRWPEVIAEDWPEEPVSSEILAEATNG